MDEDVRTDAALLAATARDPSAFAALYLRHEERVLAWLLRRTGRADLSADLCAEVFAAALSSAHRFRDSGPPAERGSSASHATSSARVSGAGVSRRALAYGMACHRSS